MSTRLDVPHSQEKTIYAPNLRKRPANRLVEAFPEARIRVFAAMRTISNSSEFETAYKPVKPS
jgi:hypothetical protein